jgi:hypothetical protein
VAPKPTRALSIRWPLLTLGPGERNGELEKGKEREPGKDPKDAKAEQPSLLPFLPSRGNKKAKKNTFLLL